MFIFTIVFTAVWLALSTSPAAEATGTLIEVCPPTGIQRRGVEFSPGGIILTTFDKVAIWVYDIDTDRRYPLPDTRPCGTNCRLSRDARWITYLNYENYILSKMRLDGTQRTTLVNYATDVEWWSEDILLVWTPGHEAYLRPENSDEREYLDVTHITSVQPGGRWGLSIEQEGDDFTRNLLNLETRNLPGIAEQLIPLGIDLPYFNTTSWSLDGQFAYVAPVPLSEEANTIGAEIFGLRPGADIEPEQWTNLAEIYGAVRINGHAINELSWSPDGRYIAFWVIELHGPNPETDTGDALIHILDTTTLELRVYCGFSTIEHTPNPPRFVWSPGGTHVAFGGNVPGDDKGYLLLVLDVESGEITELSDGIHPTMGNPNIIAWGLPPV